MSAGGAHEVARQVDVFLQNIAIEEEQRAHRLILRGGGDLAFGCEVGQEGADPSTGSGRRFIFAHVLWVALLVEEDVAFDPIHVRLFGAIGVMFRA